MRLPAKRSATLLRILALLAAAVLFSHADERYPPMFKEIALPLYEAYGFTKTLAPLPGLGALQEGFISEAARLLEQGRELETQTPPDPAAAKRYLAELRRVKQLHARFLAESRKRLLEAIDKDDYDRFEQIAASGLPGLADQAGVLGRIIAYYRGHRQTRRHPYLDAIVRDAIGEKGMYRRYLATKDANPSPFVMTLPVTLGEGMETLDEPARQELFEAAKGSGIALEAWRDDYAVYGYEKGNFFFLFFTSAAQQCERDYLVARIYREKVYYDAEGREAKNSYAYAVDAYKTGPERETLAYAPHRYSDTLQGFSRLRVSESVELGCGIVEKSLETPRWPYAQPRHSFADSSQESDLYDAAGFFHRMRYEVVYTVDANGTTAIQWPEFLE